MNTSKIYVVMLNNYQNGMLKYSDIISICNNKFDAIQNLIKCIKQLQVNYVVDDEEKGKYGICFRKVKQNQDNAKETAILTIQYGIPNVSFLAYDLCDLSSLL